MSNDELRKQLARLERELAQIRAQIDGTPGRWWVDQAGRFAKDKEFRKIVRLGRAYRKSQQPKRDS